MGKSSIVIVIAAAVLAPRPAQASCEDSQNPFYVDGMEPKKFAHPTDDVPVTIRPWITTSCHYDESKHDCSLVSDDVSVPVEIVRIAACDDGWDGFDVAVWEFVPQGPLLPGRTYELHCIIGTPALTTRMDTAPASPPGKLEVRDAWIVHIGAGCCGYQDELGLDIAGLDAPYLREGGRIEVEYPDGRIYPLTEQFLTNGDRLHGTEGPIVLTPVAADGVRGEPVRIERIEERDGACRVGRMPASFGLWLLVPLAWAGISRRRGAGSSRVRGA